MSWISRSQLTALAALLLALVAAPLPCAAEFLRTGYGVYQHTDLRLKVVIAHGTESAGIFIVQAAAPVDLQLFDPARISAENGALHTFIEYDYASNRYSALLIGGRRFSINGSISILLGSTRIRIDNEDKAYLSIVHNDFPGAGGPPDVLGILAMEPVVNSSGEAAVALLEAHQFELGELIKPYIITPTGLELKGEAVYSATVGLALERRKNRCLDANATLLSRAELLQRVYSLKDQNARLKVLTQILERAEREKPYSDLLALRSDEDTFIGYRDGEIVVVKPFKRNREWTVCLVEEISFDE